MGGADQIGVSDSADATISALRSYDPGAPSSGTMGAIYGTTASAGAAGYVTSMKTLNQAVKRIFDDLQSKINNECETVLKVIADMQETDADAANVLARYYPPGTEFGAAAGISGTTP